ncbi:MAG: hypothetical protein DWQ47_17295 [Acidobacteria bacterium]|mgnify:CR=1 FL=1|nr:MAG: hypothetical protein DWQ32_04695 [Acidobacteriota bacterium]REK02203.1 MAG: hypothetical protein DWQ38_07455 [Acidobacteriota bacterium]REK13994.1 MAG: hypothetical protein DWQ43_10385 [Acidobacteriota bacterium]REK41989.1 MAG: hypothetical protein DWQ47_17295 [Acidobacteriota bacterium]
MGDMNDKDETEGFAAGEMMTCPECERRVPPDRLSCIYCGAEVGLSDSQRLTAKAVFGTIEPWESGFSVVGRSTIELSEASLENTAALLSLEIGDLKELLGPGHHVPLIRVGKLAETALVIERLSNFGISAFEISDKELAPKTPPRRLRGLDFGHHGMRPQLFNESSEDLPSFIPALVVRGFLSRTEQASTEKESKRGSKTIDSSEVGTHEAVIDLYRKGDSRGFRIRTDGFDFSCLGSRKAFTAAANMDVLAEKIRAEYPDAAFENSYRRKRRLLDLVWPQNESVSSEGIERLSFRGYARKKVAYTDNEQQFTKYSRLQFLLDNRADTDEAE